ncbi:MULTISPECIES: hypothetical protein [Leptolyngbya]|jgi:hypothetical protein|uniref:Uncharacterized protein n=2 Tax=Leptolyngbya boryana TaxID=1184 RepID=A0A1Z4JJI4_LEPBY|nr:MULTISPECIES: hypothetical protein [Leptolyngbya]BAY56915.1 hypothetical protein NIES2135_37770 [Leptolyngbya boryana NIES-2135]MBD1854756.1 hypothetical protein [Leptolyngbya sp. FACHB-1624]MBD2368993.1 hypothetical protein [Leptolyngbya sp. FACHB-161]MBD2375799.1 hypothetical protein [Leptolyngbya sp. FACHB-238]MBD2399913.1 hypothetical protein [Leptolyngbya sp. FACHB-239]
MKRLRRVIRQVKSIGAEFWLVLALAGILFWLTGSAIASQVLYSSYTSPTQLQADTQLEMKLSVTILVIHAEIDQRRKATAVSIKTTDSNLKKLEYEFPMTESRQIESMIAEEIGIPIQEVRKLVRYRIVN